MDSRKNSFIINIDLSKIYSDHRKTARVLVKEVYETIKDLKHHISHLFAINNFILTSTTGHFLPDLEDVQMLHPNEEICVIPLTENHVESNEDFSATNGYALTIEKSSRKRNLSIAPEGLSTITKKAKKKKHLKTDDTPQTTCAVKQAEIDKNVQKPQDKLSPLNSPKSAKVSTSEIDKKIQKPQDKSDPLKVPTCSHTVTKIKCSKHGKRGFAPSSEASVRLSRCSDASDNSFKLYIPPKTSTEEYLSKNKINIVKIDIIQKKPTPEKVTNDSDVKISNNDYNITEDRVKKVVEYFEKVISPDSHKQVDRESEIPAKDQENTEFGQTEPSNYTKIYLSQKDANSAFTSQPESDAELVEKESAVTDLSSTSAKITEIQDETSFTTPRYISHNNSSVESDNSSNKRKRVRKRRKVNHNKSISSGVDSVVKSTPNSYQFDSSTTSGLDIANSHVRFEDNGNTEPVVQESVLKSNSSSLNSEVFTGGTIIESTPFMNAAIIEENEKIILENKSLFSPDKIQNSPLMTGKLDPKVGDFIAFKILILSEHCTPQPSDYIVGEVIEYLAPIKKVRFKIIRGIEEFSSLPTDDVFVMEESNTNQDQESNIKELSWERLIDVRLLYP